MRIAPARKSALRHGKRRHYVGLAAANCDGARERGPCWFTSTQISSIARVESEGESGGTVMAAFEAVLTGERSFPANWEKAADRPI
jgi:hypothetical protein